MKPVHARHFASDNYSGACPEVMAAIAAANHDHSPAYGYDGWTARAADLIRQLFESDCEVFFVFNGTSANSLSLATMCASYHRVICYAHNHLVSDECGAPGFFVHGVTLQGIHGQHGKLTPAAVEAAALARTDIHHNKAGALSITQATELGTVYTPAEVQELAEIAKTNALGFHMDGARIANAIATLGCRPRDLVQGVDVLSLGGTKNGMLASEAVVFFNKDLARDFEYRRKQAGQLSSKMRFLAAQWIGALESGAWLKNAQHSNAMAARLEQGLRALKFVSIVYPRQANSVFASLPSETVTELHDLGWKFYNDVGPDGAARLMCSWDTTETDVDQLVTDIGRAMR